MTGYAVQDAQLNLVSLGTVVANPLPAGLTAVALSDADYRGLLSGQKLWQAGHAVDNPDYVAQQQRDANASTLAANVSAAIDQLDTIIGAAPVTFTTVAQAQTQVRLLQTALQAVARDVKALGRLAVGRTESAS